MTADRTFQIVEELPPPEISKDEYFDLPTRGR
jgi:hypothetical protein